MPRSRARRFRRRRPWRASRALANGSQLAGSHMPRAPTCRKHAQCGEPARGPNNDSFCQVAGRSLAEPASWLTNNVFISNTTGAPSTRSASPRRSAWLTRRSAWVSRHSRSAAARPPARVRACACVPVARVWSTGGRTKCIPAETPPGSCWRFPEQFLGSNLQQQLLGVKNANGISLMCLM